MYHQRYAIDMRLNCLDVVPKYVIKPGPQMFNVKTHRSLKSDLTTVLW